MLGLLAFLMGASVGSFLNVVADRLPEGQSLIKPKSFCGSCHRTLASLELVPILSYLWLRGRCRYCRASLPVRLMAVEGAAGLLFTAIYLRFGLGAEFVVIAAAVSLLLVVALIDLERGLILNRLVYPSAAALLILAPFWPQLGLSQSFPGSSGMVASFLNSLMAGTGAFLVFLAISLLFPKGMGGGDIKLAGVIGLLVGFPGVLAALWLSVVSGGLVAAYLILVRKKPRKDIIPFGPFLSLGAIAVLLAGRDLVSWYRGLIP